MQTTSESMYRLASKGLHENGKIKHSMKKIIEAWEREHSTKFMNNGFYPLLDVGFDICLSSQRDLLHHIILGLYGKHIIGSTIYVLLRDEKGLANPRFWQSEG